MGKDFSVMSGVNCPVVLPLLMSLMLPREMLWEDVSVYQDFQVGVTAQSVSLGSMSGISSGSTTERSVPLTMGKAFSIQQI